MISIQGPVIRGRGASREFGFPTANIRYIPATEASFETGVWTAYAHTNGQKRPAVAIVGVWKQPDGSPSVEVHIFDFDADLYDQLVEVELIERFKGLTVCPSFEALKQQILADATEARRLLGIVIS